MILQSVPSEDYDEEENGLVSNSPRPPATRKLPLKARRVTAADHRISEEDEASWKLVALGICCFLGVVAVGASLAVLSRVGQDAGGTLQGTLGNGATGVKPVLAIFGFTILGEESAEQALPTNNAVAWVAASLLKDHGHLLLSPYAKGEPAFAMPEGSATKGSYIPDGELVQSWRPAGAGRLLRAKASRTSALRAVVVGPISEILQAQYGLAAPAVRATSAQTAADAFLDLRQILQEAGGGSSEDGATEAHLVLVAHPHQLPYLALVAVASGFRRVALLDPQLFEAVPWRTFGCSRLGYGGGGAAATVALDQEAHRFESYAGQLKETEPERLQRLQPLIEAVNATLDFHRCVARQAVLPGAVRACAQKP